MVGPFAPSLFSPSTPLFLYLYPGRGPLSFDLWKGFLCGPCEVCLLSVDCSLPPPPPHLLADSVFPPPFHLYQTPLRRTPSETWQVLCIPSSYQASNVVKFLDPIPPPRWEVFPLLFFFFCTGCFWPSLFERFTGHWCSIVSQWHIINPFSDCRLPRAVKFILCLPFLFFDCPWPTPSFTQGTFFWPVAPRNQLVPNFAPYWSLFFFISFCCGYLSSPPFLFAHLCPLLLVSSFSKKILGRVNTPPLGALRPRTGVLLIPSLYHFFSYLPFPLCSPPVCGNTSIPPL